MENSELVKGNRYQHILPEPGLLEYRNDEAVQTARRDIEDNFYKYNPQEVVQKLMKFNNTRLQYLLKLYYQCHNPDQYIYFIYQSAYKTYNFGFTEAYLYKTLWTDIQDFFIPFHADFISTLYCYWFFSRNSENITNASKFCDGYFKWLSKSLSEKGKVSFEEVREKLISML
jgi:hypothetical protein